jgi:nicotinamidase-related amidase
VREAALLLVDVINDLDFPGSAPLVREAERMAQRLQRLADRARRAGVPVIYVNDNFGRWQSDWRKVVARGLRPDALGRRMVERLQPTPADYFVLKPKHSGFYSTTLDLLLRYLGVRTVVLTGIATDICILFTANDAYMRDYRVVVPRDCVAANTREKSAFVLQQIREVLKGETPLSSQLRFARPRRGAPRAAPSTRRLVGSTHSHGPASRGR